MRRASDAARRDSPNSLPNMAAPRDRTAVSRWIRRIGSYDKDAISNIMQFLLCKTCTILDAHCSIIQRSRANSFTPKTPSHYVNTIGMRPCLATTVLVYGLVAKTTIPVSAWLCLVCWTASKAIRSQYPDPNPELLCFRHPCSYDGYPRYRP